MKTKKFVIGVATLLVAAILLTGCTQPLGNANLIKDTRAKYTCSGYPDWVQGTADPENGDRYQYLGHMFQADNNPGPWDNPAIGGNWFWYDLGACEGGQQDQNQSEGNFTPVDPLAANALPTKIFAPYIDISKNGLDTITTIHTKTSQKYYVLSFILADSQGKPSWLRFDANNVNQIVDGAGLDSEFASVTIMNEINTIRQAGGEVAISFGGAAGTELASHSSYTTAAQIQAAYQTIIDKYNLTWMDMNLENHAATNNMDIRMTALKNLQVANPGLRISFQLMCMPETGLTSSALAIVDKAKTAGIDIYSVGIMTMNFGSYYSQKTMGQYSIDAANKTREQLDAPGRDLTSTKIGICPMVGKNDTANIFYQASATEVLNYANDANSTVNWLAMWSLSRDNGGCAGQTAAAFNCSGIAQTEYEFTNIFKSFTVAGGGSNPTPTPVPATPTPTYTPVPGATATPTPVATATFTPTPTPTTGGGTPEWAENVAYALNQLVTYQGTTYKCLIGHTSIASWNPPVSPTLWQAQ